MDTGADTGLEEELDQMVQDRFPEGLVRTLEGKFPAATYADCEDAVSIGFQKLIEADRAMINPRGYVTTVAVNSMLRILRRAALQQLADADEEGGPEELLDAGVNEWTNPVADEAVTSGAYDFMQTAIDAWESRNIKTATRLVLAAARIGEPLSGEELAERLGDQLEEDVAVPTARQWRKRGLDRLRHELVEADLIEDNEEHR